METISYDEAAHLLRRMGFGGSKQEIRKIEGRRRADAVDHLLNYEAIDNRELDLLIARSFDFSDFRDNRRVNAGEIRRLWVTRMVHSRRQFEEKITLFWHNHFATALSKVPDFLMHVQNETLRKHALDRFDTLALKVAQDPAMLIWLDGITNVLGRPNENFARELQELFTMGINDVVTGEPNYTEEDVKEIARAFTGWKVRQNRNPALPRQIEFFVNEREHDRGLKTIYGRTANFGGEDVITTICGRRATARFLVSKLFAFFVYPLAETAADRETIERFADVYESSDHSIKALVRGIFTSDEFFSSRARFALVKQPIEFIVGALRMSGADYIPGTWDSRSGANIPAGASRNMGQDLFNPPDVDGWDLNLGWINTAAMLERFNFSNGLLSMRPRDPGAPGMSVPPDRLTGLTKKNAKKTVKNVLKALGPLEVEGSTVRALTDYLETDDRGARTAFNPNDPQTIDKKMRGLLHQVMCLPEFQLN